MDNYSHKPICLLDLGGVVFQASGKSNDRIDWPIILILNNIYGHQLNIGKDVFSRFMQDYNDRTGQSLSGDLFLELIWQTLNFNKELVERLSKHYRIVIVSDNYRENISYISHLFSFDKWADRQYYSFDFALEKSDPVFFSRLLQETGWDGSDLIFIDDSLSKIESAASCGIVGYLFEGNEQLFEKLSI